MALRWSLESIKDSEDICWVEATEDNPNHGIVAGEKYLSPVTNALIWSTIAVDLGEITETNAGEFFARIRIWETLFGAFLIRAEVDGKRPEGAAAFITETEVSDHIGLSCNVSPVSRTKWLKKVSREMDDMVVRFDRKREALTVG
jgi:hypothetical protein